VEASDYKGGIMPNYRLGKGPIAVGLEDFLTGQQQAVKLIGQLSDGVPPDELDFVSYLSDRFGPQERTHFLRVFGRSFPAGLSEEERAEAQLENDQRYKVFSMGLSQVALLCLGAPANADIEGIDPSALRQEPYPVQVFWGCGQPFNEAWTSWRRRDDGLALCFIFLLTTTWATTQEALIDLRVEDWDADRMVLVCHADPDGRVGWFSLPPELGVTQ